MSQVVIVALIIGLALFFAIRRSLGVQRIPISRLWIAPALMVWPCLQTRPGELGATGWLVIVVALGLGLALGVWRVGFSRVEPDPASGVIQVSGSPIAVLVLLAIVGAKAAAKQLVNTTPALAHFEIASFAFLMLALGSVFGARGRLLWVYLAARRTAQLPG